jgi:hypothetical protein
MFYLSPQGDRYYLGKSFTYQGRIYPGTATSFNNLGFTQVLVPPRPDDFYYIVSGPSNAGVWTTVDRNLTETRDLLSDLSLESLIAGLGPSDWRVVLKAELGTALPAEWENFRNGLRTAHTFYNSRTALAGDIPTLEQLGKTVFFPPAPGQGGIDNLFVEGTAGSAVLTVLGTEDPSNPGNYIALPTIEQSILAVGMYLNLAASAIDGEQIASVDPVGGTITIGNPLASNLAAVSPTFDWTT